MQEVDKCLRCGECCHYIINGKRKKCMFLIKVGKNLYHCRIYNNRIGKKIDEGVYCVFRENRKENIGDCPYNREEWK